jgi:TatD DNase family protein
MQFFDSHAHVHFKAFECETEEVIRRAREADVLIVTVGTQRDTSLKAVEVARTHDGVWATVGLHPNHTTEQEFIDPNEIEALSKIKTRAEIFDGNFYRELASDSKCVGIGECGLDFHDIPSVANRNDVIDKQLDALWKQIELATELSKPLVVHCRDAYSEQAKVLEDAIRNGKLAARGVMHCFGGTVADAERFVELGFMIGFTGVVTFPPRKNETKNLTAEVAKIVPLDKLLIETDAPYLAPVPMRGQKNEPSFVRHIAEFLSGLRGESLSEFAFATTQNAKRLFGVQN